MGGHQEVQPSTGCLVSAPSPRSLHAMNAKRKGTRNEHRSKAIFEAAGYNVCRAAASPLG